MSSISTSVLMSAKSAAAEYSPGHSAISIRSTLDPSRDYTRPPTAENSTYTTNTARSMSLKSARSDTSMVRTLMSLDSLSPLALSCTPSRTPAAGGGVRRLSTTHGDKHQAAEFKAATDRAQLAGPRTLAQVEMHLGIMRQRTSEISKNYSKLVGLSSILTLQRQYTIGLQNLESENKMILSLVDKVIQGGSTQKVLSAIKQLKPIMQMMQTPLVDRMPFAKFNESCTDLVKKEIQMICDKLSETSKQPVHASSFIPWNTDPSDTWVSDKASLLNEVINQQYDVVGDEILSDVMQLYDINQKLTRMVTKLHMTTLILAHLYFQCLRLQGENIILKEKVSEAISKIPDRKVSILFLTFQICRSWHGSSFIARLLFLPPTPASGSAQFSQFYGHASFE
jgi:hypothetical protein